MGGIAILWLVWAKIPTSREMRGSAPSTEKHVMPDPKKLSRITDLTPQGELITTGSQKKWVIAETRFRHLSPEQFCKIRPLFQDKLIMLPSGGMGFELKLPIELYDPVCFKKAPPRTAACPLTLQP